MFGRGTGHYLNSRSDLAKRRGSDPSEMKKQSQAGGPRLKTIEAANAANVTGGNQ